MWERKRAVHPEKMSMAAFQAVWTVKICQGIRTADRSPEMGKMNPERCQVMPVV